MKSKFLFLGLLLMTILGSSVATWAEQQQDPDCNATKCQGGNDKCCTNSAGSTFYMTTPPDPAS